MFDSGATLQEVQGPQQNSPPTKSLLSFHPDSNPAVRAGHTCNPTWAVYIKILKALLTILKLDVDLILTTSGFTLSSRPPKATRSNV